MYELGTKLPNLVKIPLNAGLQWTEVVDLLFSAMILMSKHFNLRGKFYISILEVKEIFEFFNLIEILKKSKSVIDIPLINYWFELRRVFFKPKNFMYI